MPGGGTARWAVLNLDNQVTAELASRTRAGIAWFTRSPLDSKRPYGAFLREERIFWREDGREVEIMPVKEIPLKGAHNQENVMAADRARLTYYRPRKYREVISQQGRVLLEADLNNGQRIVTGEAP